MIRQGPNESAKIQNLHGKRYIKNNEVQNEDEYRNTPPSSWELSNAEKEDSLADENLYEGLLIDLLNHLAKDLNFKYVMRVNTGNHGSLDARSGNWSGIIGQLVQRVS